ncbi:SNF2-related protein [Vulgatibacter incomptus]|uniref:Helicase (Snf2/Rad54 family) n=1 Tax=Vulgatibacter incomptus TaxID=1391653 RepID=A0A0K1P924_9BACT|nr:SNF2-related protein [Vulgatibacter incomptus]AKU89916.1 helicase (Snf2/Rad54 family) [Vulgatibacter incomptus]
MGEAVVEVLRPVGKARKDEGKSATPFHLRILAEEILRKRGGEALSRVAPALSEACVDLNPHQLEAATFGLESLATGGCVFGDEVGLGKTVEAGLVIAQLASEGRGRILILAPAPLRAQWRDELWDKFGLTAECVDGPSAKAAGRMNPFDLPVPLICSVPFAVNRPDQLKRIPWDLVVIDEAHRLRNAYKVSHKTGRAMRESLTGVPKLLLTATPLQNSLLELYGLVSLLDETILGPEDAFRALYGQLLHPPPPPGAPDEKKILAERQDLMNDLKERISPVVQRTLRRQVREYVKYTNRRSIVEDFRPSEKEQLLYDKVSEYLCREELAAIAPERRTLLTLCYRKLLGSSTFAIASTLEKLADSLEAKVGRAEEVARAQALHMGELFSGHENEDDQDGLEDEIRRIYEEEAEELLDDGEVGKKKPMTLSDCKQELKELREMVDLARSIRVNAKGDSLVRALSRSFTVAAAHGWPEKAVIFTESRRTQDYLKDLLEKNGFDGLVSILCGDGSGPEERKALVTEFREQTKILISTEAGAEGLNLQFCNLLINYDLPWNPQRVEQRIGRCHRYGQKRDVLVINMVNRSNAAEARLYELLEQKLNLFDGVFGASDEVLGALDSGVDFERRVLDIYQSCRSESEIDDAFNRLRSEMEGKISNRMQEARGVLMERFDDQVRARLKVAVGQAKEVIQKSEEQAKTLALSVLGDDASVEGDLIDVHHLPQALLDAAGGELAGGLYSVGTAAQAREQGARKLGPGAPIVKAAAKLVKSLPTEGVSFLSLDASRASPNLAPLFGKEGWWFVYKLEAGSGEPEERIAHVVLVREGGVYRALDLDTGALFVEIPARETIQRPSGGGTVSVTTAQENALSRAQAAVKLELEARRGAGADKARERWDRFTEECLEKPRRRIADAKAEWESSRKALLLEADDRERARLRRQRDSAEREYRRGLDQLRLEEQRRFGDKERAIADVMKKAAVGEIRRSLLASAYWFLG